MPSEAEGIRGVFVCVCVVAVCHGTKCEEWFCWFSAFWSRSKSSQTCVNGVSEEGNGEKGQIGGLCQCVCV